MATVNIVNGPDASAWFAMIVDHSAADEVDLLIKNEGDTGTYDVEWGDGITDLGIASGFVANHTFVGSSTQIRIRSSIGIGNIYHFSGPSANKRIKFNMNINTFKFNLNGLRELSIFSSGSTFLLTGDTNDLPLDLEILRIEGAVKINFSILRSVNANLKEFFYRYTGVETVGGALSDLPAGLTSFVISAASQNLSISGTINNIPKTVTVFTIFVNNNSNITGNVANLPPNITNFVLLEGNTVTGDLINIPSTITELRIEGNNTLFGDINNLPNTLNSFNVAGSNIISGNVSNIPCPNAFILSGNNTLTGSLSSITLESGYFIIIQGNNTVNNVSSKDYSVVTNYSLILAPSPSLLNTHVDQLIIDLDAGIATKSSITLILIGATRTSASDAAFTSITSGGGTILLS